MNALSQLKSLLCGIGSVLVKMLSVGLVLVKIGLTYPIHNPSIEERIINQ